MTQRINNLIVEAEKSHEELRIENKHLAEMISAFLLDPCSAIIQTPIGPDAVLKVYYKTKDDTTKPEGKRHDKYVNASFLQENIPLPTGFPFIKWQNMVLQIAVNLLTNNGTVLPFNEANKVIKGIKSLKELSPKDEDSKDQKSSNTDSVTFFPTLHTSYGVTSPFASHMLDTHASVSQLHAEFDFDKSLDAAIERISEKEKQKTENSKKAEKEAKVNKAKKGFVYWARQLIALPLYAVALPFVFLGNRASGKNLKM